MTEGKRVLLWSGGADSTALLIHLLKKYPGETVYTVYVKHGNLPANQQNKEIESRDAIMERLTMAGYKIEDTIIKVSVINEHALRSDREMEVGSHQALFWMFNIFPFISSGDEIYFGYISGDQTIRHLETIKRLFELASLLYMAEPYRQESPGGLPVIDVNNNRKISIHMPLIYASKGEIIEYLSEQGVLNDIWYCELSFNDKPCGTCHSCRAYFAALASNTIENSKILFRDESARNEFMAGINTLANSLTDMISNVQPEEVEKLKHEEVP